MEPAVPLECVAFLLVRDRRGLAEKRKLTKRLAPGAVAIPGGHVVEELRRLHFFAVRTWEGGLVPAEADSVMWVPLEAVQQLDFDVDRAAVTEYVRLDREGGLAWRTSA